MSSLSLLDLQRRQLDAQLGPHAKLRSTTSPANGWLSAIRSSLGMQTRQFAARLGISPQAASAIERSEREGTITLVSLRKAAAALNCDVVVAIVPRTSLEDMYSRQLITKSDAVSRSVAETMALEAQSEGVAAAVGLRGAQLHELRAKLGRRLWD